MVTKKVQELIEISQLKETLENLSQGIKSSVGERGQLLSGGERQRIGLCRGLAKDASLYIFDEATSALDLTTEQKLLSRTKEYLKGKTCIFIAHRLQSIQDCDFIFVLDQGTVIEQGSHSQLIEMNGVYARLLSDPGNGRP